jgi:hypothetical protein
MALVSQLYKMDPYEASKLSQGEVDHLIGEAQLTFIQMASSAELQEVLAPRLGRTLRTFRAARSAGMESAGGSGRSAGDPDA